MARWLLLGWSVVWLVGSACGAASAEEEGSGSAAQARVGNVLFTMPGGWRRKDLDDGVAALVPPQLPEGQWYEIRIPPSCPLKGTLRDQLRAELAGFREKFKGLEEGQVVEQRHKGGYDVAFTALSMESNAKAGEFLYWMVYLAKAGDQVQPVFIVGNSAALYQQNQKLAGEFLNGIRLASLIVLADGQPPLTKGTVDEVRDFVEWLLEVPLTEGQRQSIQRHLVESWKKSDKEEMEGAAEILKIRSQLSASTQAQRELARQALQPEAIKAWRQQQDAMAKMVLGIYDGAHKPIAPGDPPLTRQTADATVELLYFMASQVDGGGEVQPTTGVKDEWAKKLAEGYGTMNAEARKDIAQMPMAWAAVRYAWPELPATEKDKLKDQWAQSKEVKELAASLAKIRAEAAATRAERRTELMSKLQERHANYMAVSNMATMMHQANMAVIHNMNSGWTYTYRYR